MINQMQCYIYYYILIIAPKLRINVLNAVLGLNEVYLTIFIAAVNDGFVGAIYAVSSVLFGKRGLLLNSGGAVSCKDMSVFVERGEELIIRLLSHCTFDM